MQLVIVFELLLFSVWLCTVVVADETTQIKAQSNWGSWTGWGTSLAWWAAAFGNRVDLADIFFTLNSTSFNNISLPGLGLNIARYNAGASSFNSIGGTTMVASPNIIPSRQMEGYWLDWYSEDPLSSSWNWYLDANQRNMLWMARDRNVNHLELFSNSPMWWMCYNHNPSGASSGSSNNLQSWNLQNHTIYLATIAAYAKQYWGVNFESVEPFNEPSSNWWVATGTQEGCHFDVATQATVIGYLRAQLNSRGLTSTLVSASDENTYDLALSTFNGLGNTALNSVGRVNVHGYEDGSGRRDALYAAVSARGLPLWNSEYGDADASGESLVSNLILDFRWLHMNAWVYWQALDGGAWGLIQGDESGKTTGPINQKYYAVAQFTRHIREGMKILDGGSDYTVAAYNANKQQLIIVAINWGSPQYINFDLSLFSQPSISGSLVSRWSTHIGGTENYVSYSDTYMSGSRFWSWFDTNHLQTFQVNNVIV